VNTTKPETNNTAKTSASELYLVEPEVFEMLRGVARRLCGGSDRMRDEGNLLVHLLNDRVHKVPVEELRKL
jgi:hypothetical protein